MIELGVSLIWASLILFFLIRLEHNFKRWQGTQKPLGDKQYQELTKKIDDLQSQISRLSLDKGFNE